MCGIFGFAKKGESQNDFQIEKIREVISNLADSSIVRGDDSTGIALISPRYNNIWKSTLSSVEMTSHSDWDTVLSGINRDTTVGLGHVRLATHGTISAKNSHPFSIGGVIGAHNGVLRNHDSLASEMNIDIEVDSEAIFASIDKYGVKEGVEKLSGDYALTFVKDNPYELYLLRDDSRPINFTYWKKAKTLFWASTRDILEEGLRASGLMLKTQSLQNEYIFKIDTRDFSKKPAYTSEKFTPKISYDNYYYYGYNPRQYNYGTYTSMPTKCGICDKDTYNYECICTNCQYISDTQYQCEFCQSYFDPDKLLYVNENMTCYGCSNEDSPSCDSKWPSRYSKLINCDGCTESVLEEEITIYGQYNICEVCDRDDEIRTFLGGNYCD